MEKLSRSLFGSSLDRGRDTRLGLGPTHRRSDRAVALGELVEAARRVHEALFAREVGMARGTDPDAQVLHRGAGVVDMPASAGDRGIVGFGMDVLSHGNDSTNVIWHSVALAEPGRGAERLGGVPSG